MENKNKKSNKRKIFTLLLIMLFTIILLSTSTYAWFTANKVITISPIQVNVATVGGIQISADGANWRATVGFAELIGSTINTNYATNVNQIPANMNPVSTGKTIDATGKMEMFRGTVESNTGGDYILTAAKDTEIRGTTGNFVAFDIFIRADANTNLYLTPNSQITVPIDGGGQPETDTGIKNAARIAFIVLGNTSLTSPISTIQALNGGASSPAYLWEPNYDVHSASAVVHALNTYSIVTSQTGAAQLTYSGVYAPITAANNVLVSAAVGTTSYVTPVVPDYSTVSNFSSDVTVFSVLQGITKLRVYMWIEGQDVDCENVASGGNVVFNVQLTSETT